ncbi:hypothetical protein Tco_1027060 [Tanacetum coccineum]
MVINSPCLTDKKELAIPGQTETGKELSNPLMTGSLPKTIMPIQLPSGSEEFHQIIDFLSESHIKYALTHSPTVYAFLIEQFWQTVALSTLEDGVMAITVTVDRNVNVLVTEASIRRHFKLNDSKGLSTLSTAEIFKHLALMGLEEDLKETKKVYCKALTKLVKKVNHLEDKLKSTTARRKARLDIFYDEEDLVSEDTSKKGRMTETENEGVETNDIDLGILSTAKILADTSGRRVKTYSRRRRSTGSSRVSTTEEYDDLLEQDGLFQRKSYDEIRPIFEVEYKKKLRTVEASRSEYIQEQQIEEPIKLSKEELKGMIVIVPKKGINVEDLQTKGDLEKLWSLVKEKFNTTEPTDDKEKALWVNLKRLFKPDENDTLWKLQRYMHDPLTWSLYAMSGVHHVSTERGHDIFMLVEKDYPVTRGVMTVMLSNKLKGDGYSVLAEELVRKIFMEVNKPRRS